jgi:hypothetical protein
MPLRLAWLILAALLAAVACADKLDPFPDCGPPPAPGDPNIVTYSNRVKLLIDTKCTSCHSKAAVNRAGASDIVDLESYEGVREWGPQVVQNVMGGRMPPNADPNGALTLQQRCAVYTWSLQGYMQ